MIKCEGTRWIVPVGGVRGQYLEHLCRLPSAPIFPIFSYIFRASYFFLYFDPKSYIFHQTPIFFKMLQIIMKYQGKIMEFWFEMPVLMSLAFIFFLARFARS